MQFTYHPQSSVDFLEIQEDTYKYLFKARRQKISDEIYFRNLDDKYIYLYKVIDIDKKKAICKLISKEEKIIENSKKLHLIWCIIDPKTIEKSLASLNELGVYKITFLYCDYSQKNFKINFDKLEKILINSSSQCGRSSIIKLDASSSLDEFLQNNNDVYALNFSSQLIDEKKESITKLIIGCEGGFSKDEENKFDKEKIVGFKSNLILKSETAIISAASKILI
ncbi:16S rRNA (uracil(1498)-N(3))-methyltransferase [Arcobacter sp. LA11]|uniref:16S rRNA (uracil(1498)-N(3))-methyltransferase n=1 Tax=Arcobacter sp. LA11 TaxID=1898176 RepID=UPI000932C5DC|nr:16S rRNA (uracil(1498)-N(3))-methyltransferase [Arcobacter sp. LA11]